MMIKVLTTIHIELNFLGSCDPTTMVQAVVLMKGLDACFMAEGNPVSFVGEMLCNLRDFIMNGWPNSKTDVPVSKLCHWFFIHFFKMN